MCRSQAKAASLIIDLGLGSGAPMLRENVAGMGTDVQDSIKQGVLMWSMSVLVAAFALFDAEGHPGHLAAVKRLEIGGIAWKIVSSPAFAMSYGDAKRDKGAPPPATWPFLELFAVDLAEEKRLHSLKVLVMQTDAGRHIETSVDGVPSPHLAPLLNDFRWLPDGESGWIRQFHLMEPQ